jgi:ABC-type phosphate/phosphonate transport system substrate-binding protein
LQQKGKQGMIERSESRGASKCRCAGIPVPAGSQAVLFLTSILIAAAMILSTPAFCTASQKEKSYTLGMFLKFATEMDAQNKTIYSDITDAFSKSQGIKLSFKWYNDEAEFLKAIRNGDLDFFYTGQKDVFAKSSNDFDFLMTPFFLNKKDSSLCVYVNKEGNYKNLKDLRGKKILAEPDRFTYYILRDFLGEKPDVFFSAFVNSPSAMSAIYSLAMNTTDSIFVADHSVQFLKVNNPGPTKKIISVKCTENIPFPPMMAKKKLPEDVVSKLKSFLLNVRTEESVKKYRPLIITYKVGFSPIAEGEYDATIAFCKKAIKSGWDKEYDNWIKNTKQEGK